MSQKVISLNDFKQKRAISTPKHKLYQLSKAELLQQLLDYYEAVKKDPFSLSIALWGEDLMDVISSRAMTKELTELAEDHKQLGPSKVFQLD